MTVPPPDVRSAENEGFLPGYTIFESGSVILSTVFWQLSPAGRRGVPDLVDDVHPIANMKVAKERVPKVLVIGWIPFLTSGYLNIFGSSAGQQVNE